MTERKEGYYWVMRGGHLWEIARFKKDRGWTVCDMTMDYKDEDFPIIGPRIPIPTEPTCERCHGPFGKGGFVITSDNEMICKACHLYGKIKDFVKVCNPKGGVAGSPGCDADCTLNDICMDVNK